MDVGVGREEDHFRAGSHLPDLTGPVEAFVAGVGVGIEVHVQQHDVRAEGFQRGDERRGRRDQLHLREMRRQQQPEGGPDALVVVHDEDLAFLFHAQHKVRHF